jgi:hypothetical protein
VIASALAPPAWLPVVALAGGLALLAAAWWRRRRRTQRHASWPRATGRVVDEVLGAGEGGGSPPSMVPVVEFETDDGIPVRGQPRTWTWAGVSRLGRSAQVAYDPTDPRRFDAWFGRDLTGLPLVLAGLATIAFGLSLRG